MGLIWATASVTSVRVFTALYPSPAALADLDRVVDPLRRRHGDLTWTRSEQWHLTLTFHGNLDPDRLERFDRVVARCASVRSVTSARLSGGGAFPSTTRGRMLWAGVEAADGRLVELHRNLAARLRRSGWDVDRRRYRPHLTLARSRRSRDLSPLVDALVGYHGPDWDVDRIVVVVSRSGRGGRFHHERLGEHLLRHAGS
jgi:RNA 2',3'-cyclic 3'-phosphodiesterase